MVKASVPSRVCLFGEHQDYLGLEVIAAAIDLRFCASVTPREDMQLQIRFATAHCRRLGRRIPDGTRHIHWISRSRRFMRDSGIISVRWSMS